MCACSSQDHPYLDYAHITPDFPADNASLLIMEYLHNGTSVTRVHKHCLRSFHEPCAFFVVFVVFDGGAGCDFVAGKRKMTSKEVSKRMYRGCLGPSLHPPSILTCLYHHHHSRYCPPHCCSRHQAHRTLPYRRCPPHLPTRCHRQPHCLKQPSWTALHQI